MYKGPLSTYTHTSYTQLLGTIHGGGRTSPLQSSLLAVFLALCLDVSSVLLPRIKGLNSTLCLDLSITLAHSYVSPHLCTEDCKKYGQTPWEAATNRVNVCWAKKNKVLVFCHYFSFETCTSIRTCTYTFKAQNYYKEFQ